MKPVIQIITNVVGGTSRCIAIRNILSSVAGNSIMLANEERATAAVRDAFALCAIAIQPETRQFSGPSGQPQTVGRATGIVMVDCVPVLVITLHRDNTISISGIGSVSWEGAIEEWRAHRSEGLHLITPVAAAQ